MVFNVLTQYSGLFNFLKRYGGIVEEIGRLLGFTTTDPGVGGNFNVVFNAPWRNVKGKPYKSLIKQDLLP